MKRQGLSWRGGLWELRWECPPQQVWGSQVHTPGRVGSGYCHLPSHMQSTTFLNQRLWTWPVSPTILPSLFTRGNTDAWEVMQAQLGGDSVAQSLLTSLACLIHITSEFLTKDVRSKTTQNILLSPPNLTKCVETKDILICLVCTCTCMPPTTTKSIFRNGWEDDYKIKPATPQSLIITNLCGLWWKKRM